MSAREDAIKKVCVKPLFDLDIVYIEPFVNRFSRVDMRVLPRVENGKMEKGRNCERCGELSGPYALCRNHREQGTILRVLKNLEEEGKVERVTDGRGRKGGSLWKAKKQSGGDER